MQSYRLAYHIKQLRRRHPGVDIIVIEPRSDDFQMTFYNIMRYSARVTVAQHGFESVAVDLANQYSAFKATLARHGIPITRRFVIEELETIRESDNDIAVVRDILESDTHNRASSLSTRSRCTQSLNEVLSDLEHVMDRLEARHTVS